jgi:hypothetical protein
MDGVPELVDGSGCSFVARAPDSQVWVSFDDLPASKFEVLEKRLNASLAECWMCGTIRKTDHGCVRETANTLD